MNFKEKISNEKTIRDLDNVSKTELHEVVPARKRAKMSENGELRSSNQLLDEINSSTSCLLNSTNAYAHNKSNELAPSYLFIVNKVKICTQTNTVELSLSKVNMNHTVNNNNISEIVAVAVAMNNMTQFAVYTILGKLYISCFSYVYI